MASLLLSNWIKVKVQTNRDQDFEDIRGEVRKVTPVNASPEKVAKAYCEAEDVWQVRWNWCEVNGEETRASHNQGHYHVGAAQVKKYPFLKVGMAG